MAEKILLEIVTPEKRVLSESVDIVVAPGELGEFGVLPGHIPFLCKLKIGELRYRLGAASHHVAIMGAMAVRFHEYKACGTFDGTLSGFWNFALEPMLDHLEAWDCMSSEHFGHLS